MKKLLFTLSTSLLFLSSYAQWNLQSSTVGGSVTGIHFADANTGFAVTKTDTIIGTTNGGATWGYNYAPGYPLYAIHCINTNTVYACGANGTFYYTYDGGAIWTQASTGQGYNLYGMHWANPDTGWAVGFNGVIIRTNNGGSFWSGQTSGTSNNLNSVCFVDPYTGFAVGDLGTALRTTDGGATWNPLSTGSGANLNSVFFVDPATGYICGAGGTILRTTDGGNTWLSLSSGTSNTLTSIIAYGGNLWTCGQVGTVLKSVDAGSTWFPQTSNTLENLNSVFFLNGSTGFASGANGAIINTLDGGCATPTISVAGSTTICDQTSTNLTASGVSTFWYWQPSTGLSSTNTASTTANPNTSTTYTVSGYSSDGCYAEYSFNLVVNPLPGVTTSWSGIACNGSCTGSDSAVCATAVSWLWSTGETTPKISNLCAGYYTVTVTDINGCSSTVGGPINEPPPLTAGISVQNNATCMGIADGTLKASATGGTLPYSLTWMPGGATSVTNSNLAVGDYTLTVVDANSCPSATATATVGETSPIFATINGPSALCQNQPAQLTYTTSGASPYTLDWYDSINASSFCSLDTAILTQTTPGLDNVILTLTDANGCITKDTLGVTINTSDSLSGFVTEPNSNPVSNGEVYLFRQQALHAGLLDTLGTVSIVNGAYAFPQLYYGDYFLKVIADPQAYPTAIATYYSNKTYPFQWDSALVINHHTCSGSNAGPYNLSILEITPLGGPGVISGYVTAGPGYGQRVGVGGHVMGAPLKGIDVKLGRNPGGSPAARTTTDSITGQYVFTNIPLDSAFTIYVDIPNYGMDSTLTITLTSGNTLSNNNNYYVDSLMVRVDVDGTTGIISVVNDAEVSVYPNPVSENMCVVNGADKTQAILLNAFGTEIRKEDLNAGKACFDANNLPAGIYFVRIQTLHGLVTRKVLVQH